MNNSELSYMSEDGFTVFTSQYHRKRGTCCKSNCLHCPFGYTLKKLGLSFEDVTNDDQSLLETFFLKRGSSDIGPLVLKKIILKGHVVGVMLINHIVVKELFLLSQFQDQGLSKEIIESYYFI